MSRLRSAVAGLSLRTRLVAGMVVLVAVGLVVAGGVATSALRSYQLDRVDAQLAEGAQETTSGGHGVPDHGGTGGPALRLPGELYRAVLSGSGTVLASSADGEGDGDAPAVPALTAAQATSRGTAPFTVPSADGHGSWRVVAVPVEADGSDATLLLAADLGPVDATVQRLVVLELAIGALVLVGVTLLGLALVRSSLRGLAEVEEAAAEVAAGRLDQRVPERSLRTEIGSLGASFNAMVERVESSFAARAASEDRLRQFVADASHELRTPLTSIRGFAELYRQGAVTDTTDVARLLRRIEDEAQRMGLLVEDLLALARLDEQRPLALADVDLTELALDAVHDARAVQPGRRVTVVADGPVLVTGDDARLRQVVVNLVSNALQHTPSSASVRLTVRAEHGSGLLEVADDGPGMPPEVAANVFERLYRADSSRTRASGGSGLGLAIVASLVQAHGGTVDLETAPGGGAAFTVRLPLRREAPAPRELALAR